MDNETPFEGSLLKTARPTERPRPTCVLMSAVLQHSMDVKTRKSDNDMPRPATYDGA